MIAINRNSIVTSIINVLLIRYLYFDLVHNDELEVVLSAYVSFNKCTMSFINIGVIGWSFSVRKLNRHSIGICYEGGLDEEGRPTDTRTQAQRFALLDLLTILKHQYPDAQILGHYQLSASIHKACPCFDSRKEYMNI